MKRIILAVLMMTLALTATRQARAQVDVSLNFFYDNIETGGNWVELADYGYCWQPSIAVSNVRWRPYWDGYWAYTDVGWTWVSYEDFGWATYHYGRWVRLRDRGWFWVPGREWGPAWVSWRTGGDYVGWAPLPPRAVDEFVYESSPITGQVDLEFDIGPAYYNFVDVRYIGEPVLRERIVEPNLNVTYISNTVNVTNISYANSVVYNYGPDYNTLSQYSTRPIRRMTLERETSADLNAAAKAKSLTKVQGDKLLVAAPLALQKPATAVAPKTVKEKIAKPTVERGWSSVSDPKAQAELKEKMKSENPKNIPPPNIKPREAAPGSPAVPATGSTPAKPPVTAPNSAASPHPAATSSKTSESTAMSPDKGKEKQPRGLTPMPTAATAATANPAMTPPGKSKKDRYSRPIPGVAPSGPNAVGTTPAPAPKKPSERRQEPPSSLATSPDGTPFREPPVREKEARKEKQAEKAPALMPPVRQPSEPAAERAPRKPRNEPSMPPSGQAPPDLQPKQRPMPPERVAPPPSSRQAPPPEAPRKHPLPPERTAPPAPGPAANAPGRPQPPQEKREKGKKGNQPAPTPGQ